jgi:hypothetical protein
MLVDTFIRWFCPALTLLLAPDVILVNGGAAVKTLARRGGNATGFMQFGYRLTGKCLEMLKEVAPGGRARQ